MNALARGAKALAVRIFESAESDDVSDTYGCKVPGFADDLLNREGGVEALSSRTTVQPSL